MMRDDECFLGMEGIQDDAVILLDAASKVVRVNFEGMLIAPLEVFTKRQLNSISKRVHSLTKPPHSAAQGGGK
jgi:hypothetical protein